MAVGPWRSAHGGARRLGALNVDAENFRDVAAKISLGLGINTEVVRRQRSTRSCVDKKKGKAARDANKVCSAN